MPEEFTPNYDEASVPAYWLPDPLLCADGTRVGDAGTWERKRRPELLELFREHMYGRMPGRPAGMHWSLLEEGKALGGRARRRQIRVYLTAADTDPSFDLLLYLPAEPRAPAPAFLGLNFQGNHSVHSDPAVLLCRSWIHNSPPDGVTENRACEQARGCRAPAWSVERILERGYALATVCYGDIDPDYDDGFGNGVHPLFREMGVARESLSSIAAWAWGLHRALDYLEQDGAVDASRVAVMGHSRLGKTALWAGATDERFRMVVSNDSGCGGAALSRRPIGETVARINAVFPHWFCAAFHGYGDRESELPVDQHELLALCAPRALYVASAAEDLWADPRGEYLSAYHASPVYALYGLGAPTASEPPAVHRPVGDALRYHVRAGGHDVLAYDWDRFLDLADRAATLPRAGSRPGATPP